ncbi:MAG: hypothetical protein B7Z58_09140 [Acidiphilium sp. 37-64-53]|nr:MAG: hypothetical protein B7Z58_09140 [Acidiphilium sp. 37-64-53]OZB30595.1 MAG: hypothetical protein B7X49_02495 [Acidiphilium sp. 34-64-41]
MTDRRFDGKGGWTILQETLVTRPAHHLVRLAPILLATLTVSACTGSKAPELYCPQVAVLQQASRVILANANSNDIAAQTLDGRITGVAGTCHEAGKDMETVTFRIGFAATNGPASRLAEQTLPYFIAIVQGDNIISKRVFPVSFDFKNGADQAIASTTPITLKFPRAPRSAHQQVLVGFQMNQAELDRTGEPAAAP